MQGIYTKGTFLLNHKPFEQILQNVIVDESYAGQRIDVVLASLLPEYSRSQLQKWLKQGQILINGQQRQAKEKLFGGEFIEIKAELACVTRWHAESIDLDIIYEDEDVMVINKPVGLVVHPGAGNTSGTLSNGLLAHYPPIELVPRCGIVHRLDKDTSGLLVVAKTLQAHSSLVQQLQARTVKREYEAIACGYITAGGTVDAPIGRSPHNRLKMAVTKMGKSAVTHFNILERFRNHTRIRCRLETGRTHQIRVHLAHINAPLLGDPLYSRRQRIDQRMDQQLKDYLKQYHTQALHAYQLGFKHPISGQSLAFKAALPESMAVLISLMRQDADPLYQQADDDEDFFDENDIDF